MRKQLYWLDDAAWKRIEPLMPCGRRGARRVDDRRVVSGIMHMLRCGARWRDCPPEYGPQHNGLQSIQPMEPPGHLDRYLLRPNGHDRHGRDDVDRQHAHQGTSLGFRRKRGDFQHAIGRSRGGRTTKSTR